MALVCLQDAFKAGALAHENGVGVTTLQIAKTVERDATVLVKRSDSFAENGDDLFVRVTRLCTIELMQGLVVKGTAARSAVAIGEIDGGNEVGTLNTRLFL